jgi:hypothetical protein
MDFYPGRCRVLRRWPRGQQDPAPGSPRHPHDQHGNTGTYPQPGAIGEQPDIGADDAGSKYTTGDATEAHQAIEPPGRSRGDAIVQEREKRGHHERAEQVTEQVEAPHSGVTGRMQPAAEQQVAGNEKQGENMGQLLSSQTVAEVGEHHHGDESHPHVEYLGQQFCLRGTERQTQQVESGLVVILDKQSFLERLEYPEAGDDQKEIGKHQQGEGQFLPRHAQGWTASLSHPCSTPDGSGHAPAGCSRTGPGCHLSPERTASFRIRSRRASMPSICRWCR